MYTGNFLQSFKWNIMATFGHIKYLDLHIEYIESVSFIYISKFGWSAILQNVLFDNNGIYIVQVLVYFT